MIMTLSELLNSLSRQIAIFIAFMSKRRAKSYSSILLSVQETPS
jgi:hypothetical protein